MKPCLLLLLVLFGHSAIAQRHRTPADTPRVRACLVPDEVRNGKRTMFIISPSLTYAPETRLSFGVYTMYYFKMGDKGSCTRPSQIQFSSAYTMNRQFSAEPTWDVISARDNYLFSGRGLYQKYPEAFFGIGNNTTELDKEMYSHQLVRISARAQKRFYDRFFAGPMYHFETMWAVKSSKAGGLISDDKVTGAAGSLASGAGVDITWDTRDLVLNPHQGLYVDMNATFFDPAFGSRFTFGRYIAEVRKYLPFRNGRDILALQGFAQHTGGTAPFRMLPLVGGSTLMRGYYSGRYRDKDYLAAQAEYRFPLYRRLGMTVFGAAGQVAPSPSAMRAGGFHPSYGVGLRYMYNVKEKINIRADFGFGPHTNGQYITIGEAF